MISSPCREGRTPVASLQAVSFTDTVLLSLAAPGDAGGLAADHARGNGAAHVRGAPARPAKAIRERPDALTHLAFDPRHACHHGHLPSPCP